MSTPENRTAQDALAIEYADLGVTFGYIGNIERWGNDRSFRIFTKTSDRYGAGACNGSIPTAADPTAEDCTRARPILDRYREELLTGKRFLVGQSRWLDRAVADAAKGTVPTYWKY